MSESERERVGGVVRKGLAVVQSIPDQGAARLDAIPSVWFLSHLSSSKVLCSLSAGKMLLYLPEDV